MNKKLIFIIIFGLILCGNVRPIYSASSGNMEGSIYAYKDDDVPQVFFFPKEKARWDGNKVTMSEWYMLTDLQKEKFVSEYLGELKKQYQGAFEILGLDYLKALDLFSYYANEKAKSEPSTKVIDLLVKGQESNGVVLKK